MLKNAKKFNDIKLAHCIDLSLVPTKTKKQDQGLSVQKYNNKWFVIQNGKAIFKTYDNWYKDDIKNIRMANELICYYLAKQLNINCAKYQPAHFDGDYGLISYNFLYGGDKLVPLYKFLKQMGDNSVSYTLTAIADALKTYSQIDQNTKKENIIFDVFKVMFFDTLTLQTDRHASNLNFIVNKNAPIRLAPLFDNEFAFNVEYLDTLCMYDYVTFEDFLTSYSKNAKMVSVDYEMISSNRFKNNLTNIVNLAKCNPMFEQFVKDSLSKIDLDLVFKKVLQSGLKVNQYYKTYVKTLISKTASLFEQELKAPKTDNYNYIYNEFII